MGGLKKRLKTLANQAQARLVCYKMKVSLVGTEPIVWRHVQVDAEFTLEELHAILQEVFGWRDEQLHKFVLNKDVFVDPDSDHGVEGAWDEDIMLYALGLKKGTRFTYDYGFVDGWQHEILIEDVFSLSKPDDYEQVLGGQGDCPKEKGGAKGSRQSPGAHARVPQDASVR